jgi:hypothetical protein
VDNHTGTVFPISFFLNFVDFTSIPFVLGKFQFFLELGCFVYLILLIIYTIICAIFFRQIMASQPWLVWLLHGFYEFTFKVLYIPLITIPISSFDCYHNSFGEHIVRMSGDTSCVSGSLLQLITMIFSIVHLLLFLIFTCIISLCIYPHNCKKGLFIISVSVYL